MPLDRCCGVRAARRREPAGRRQRRAHEPSIDAHDREQHPGRRARASRHPPTHPVDDRADRRRGGDDDPTGEHHRACGHRRTTPLPPGPAAADPARAALAAAPAADSPLAGSRSAVPSRAEAGRVLSNRPSAASRSWPSAAESAWRAAGRARTTTRAPHGSRPSRSRTRCRSRRTTRCRSTDPPTARPTTKPTRAGPSGSAGPAGASTCTASAPRVARRPRRTVSVKSWRRVNRVARGSTAWPRRCPDERTACRPRSPRSRGGSRRQLGATLAAPSSDDGPPGAGAHPEPEAVRPGATTVVRLKGALAHVRTPSRGRRQRPRRRAWATPNRGGGTW